MGGSAIVVEEAVPVGRGVEVALNWSEPPFPSPLKMLGKLRGGGGLRVWQIRAIETRLQLHAAPHAKGIAPGNLRKGCCVGPAQEF